MEEFISEPITPDGPPHPSFIAATGEPMLPRAFRWRDRTHEVCEVIASWKQSSREGGRAGGEAYLRRHVYKLRMDDDATWTVYFTRQASASGKRTARWFLYTRADEDEADGRGPEGIERADRERHA